MFSQYVNMFGFFPICSKFQVFPSFKEAKLVAAALSAWSSQHGGFGAPRTVEPGELRRSKTDQRGSKIKKIFKDDQSVTDLMQ
jgi:hypothetical protein